MNKLLIDLYYGYLNSEEYLKEEEKLNAEREIILAPLRSNLANALRTNKHDDIKHSVASIICGSEEVGFILGFKYAMRMLLTCDIQIDIEQITNEDKVS